jgi:hypothetical protein
MGTPSLQFVPFVWPFAFEPRRSTFTARVCLSRNERQTQRVKIFRVWSLSLYGHDAFVIEIVSILQPGRAAASSDPIRKRSLMVCPATFGPRLITELM